MLVDPAHVVTELAQSLIATLRQLELDHNIFAASIDRQQINAATVNRELDATSIVRSIQPEATFDSIQVACKKVLEVRLKGAL